MVYIVPLFAIGQSTAVNTNGSLITEQVISLKMIIVEATEILLLKW